MEQQPPTPVNYFGYPEAQTRMRAGLKVKREKWPSGMFLTMEKIAGEETTMITQPPRKVPIALHDNDLGAIDWTEIP